MQVVEQRVITPEQHTAEPLWATFCGTSGGLWNGQLAAFSPATGAPVLCVCVCVGPICTLPMQYQLHAGRVLVQPLVPPLCACASGPAEQLIQRAVGSKLVGGSKLLLVT